MLAIYKREVKSFFDSFIGWLFIAVTLFIMGIYFTVFNMLAGYPTISYVLQSIVFLFIILFFSFMFLIFIIPLMIWRIGWSN